MLNEEELKTRLQQIAAQDYPAPPESEIPALLEAMLAHLGSLDSELRDDLIYRTLANWIMQDRMPAGQLPALLDTLLGEHHLFFRLGEAETASVFRRSFSMLLLPPLLIAHRQRACLRPGQVRAALEAVLRYLPLEHDRRGFVPGSGWAHTIAHTADALDDLAQCAELHATDLLAILQAICTVMSEPQFVYTHDEAERMSIAAVAVFRRPELGLDEKVEWLQSLGVSGEAFDDGLPQIYARQNLKHLLQSIYFRLGRPENQAQLSAHQRASLEDAILATLTALVRY